MKIIYLTNKDVKDENLIPNYLRKFNDEVIILKNKFDLNYVIKNSIDFIVSDRTRFLITSDIVKHLDKKIINLHPSFLPWCKGVYPNYWSIKTNVPHGVTLHYIDEGIDTGDIIAQTRLFYNKGETLRNTYDRLRAHMVRLFETCWPNVKIGNAQSFPQNKKEGSIYYKKDFEGHFEKLKSGWDTLISEIQ